MKKIITHQAVPTLDHMKENHYAVIMAGGSGTRLWPMSRKSSPKQFQSLLGSGAQTMFQMMYELLREVFTPSHIFVQTDKRFKSIVETQIPELPKENILLEPEARDTGPALGFATAALLHRDKSAKMGIFYSDHVIKNKEQFINAVKVAYQSAEDFPEHIAMIGVKPTFPHTGLGYIQINSQVKNYFEGEVFNVERFIEKPDFDTAEKFVLSWEYLWNTGYKVCTASTLFDLIEKLDKNMVTTLRKIVDLITHPTDKSEKQIADLYHALPRVSFEYLATEKLENLLVVPSDMGWSDIGDWKTLHEMMMETTNHHLVSKGHHVSVDTESSLVYAGDRMIATLGLRDIVIVDTGDVILVADKNRAQDMKKLITTLEDQNKHTYL